MVSVFCGPETRVCIRPENIVAAVKFTNFSTGDVGIIAQNCTGDGETTQAQDEKPIIDLVSHIRNYIYCHGSQASFGGGKDASKLDEALAKARSLLG